MNDKPVLQFIQEQAFIQVTNIIHDFLPPVYYKTIYPTLNDYITFYLDEVHKRIITIGERIKKSCVLHNYIETDTDHTLDDDIFITLCELLQPLVNKVVHSKTGNNLEYNLKDWR